MDGDSDMRDIVKFFQEFRDFAKTERLRGALRGDPLSCVAQDWDYWLLSLPDGSAGKIRAACKAASFSPGQQKRFTDWLGGEPEFGGRLSLALLQIARCAEFDGWTTLQEYRQWPKDRLGVHAALVVGSEGVVRRVSAIAVPKGDGRSEPRALPLDFDGNPGDLQVLTEAREAAEFFYRRSWLFFLVYALAGDILLVSAWRAAAMAWTTRGFAARLKGSDLYVSVESAPDARILGRSMGLACFLAMLAAPGRHLFSFVPTFLPNLAASGFTGDLRARKIGKISMTREKLEAMKESGLQFAFIPRENEQEASIAGLRTYAFRSLWRVLAQLVPLRKTYGGLNAFVMCLLAFGLPVYHQIGYRTARAPLLAAVESSYGIMDINAAASAGLKVHATDRIRIVLARDPGDGYTKIRLTGLRENGKRLEMLKTIQSVEGWHSELTLPVQNGQVEFDYSHTRAGDQDVIELFVIRGDRVVTEYPLPIVVR
jgi:hypothetical protein